MFRRAFITSGAALAASGLLFSESHGQADAVRKVAFLVGVSNYNKDGFDALSYCEQDVEELAAELRKHGFTVDTLTGAAATKAKVDEWLKSAFASLSKLDKQDVALLGFSGHGVQSLVKNPVADQPDIEDAFFCPVDAIKSRTDTMISISWVISQLDASSGSSQNLVLVDACRNIPNKGMKTIDGSTAKELPSKISVLFSSSGGERSYESAKAKHGVFTHVLLQGLRGKAANKNGQITWLTLASYVLDAVPQQAPELLDDPTAVQQPNLLGNLARQPVLARLDRRQPPPVRPGLLRAPFTAMEARQAQQAWADYLGVSRTKRDAASGVTLVLIPPGEFTMGSSQAERDQMLKLYKDRYPGEFAYEKLHSVRITQPFYLGAHEVTVGQFRRFVTATGYKTDAEKDGEGGMGWNETEGQFEDRKPRYSWRNPGFSQTDEHPVVNVSWRDAVAFCDWLGREDGGTYRLPREAEWEYACRAGSTTAFWNGDDVESLATIGNILDASAKAKWKNYPWSFVKRSDGFVFTSPVGNYPSNGFGLYDMHGNVWEWCSDRWGEYPDVAESDPEGPKEGSARMFRGGGWCGEAADCRAAYRNGGVPTDRWSVLGFRLALSFVGVPAGSGQDQKK